MSRQQTGSDNGSDWSAPLFKILPQADNYKTKSESSKEEKGVTQSLFSFQFRKQPKGKILQIF